MRWSGTLLIGLLFLTSVPAHGMQPGQLKLSPEKLKQPEAVPVGLRDVIDTVEKSYQQLSDVKADFFQRSTMAAGNKEFRATGEMYLKPAGNQPVMFRFDYFRPTTQQIISNGRSMWIYLPENRQVIYSDVSSIFQSRKPSATSNVRATNFIEGLGRISQDFQITFAPATYDLDGNYVLELTPRMPTAYITKVFIVVEKDAVINYVRNRGNFTSTTHKELLFPILSTTVTDHEGNSTTIELSNIRTNSFLPLNLFDFPIPLGVEVVRPPGPANRGAGLEKGSMDHLPQ